MESSYETLEEQVYQQLLNAIQVGQLAPGARLITSQLAGSYQVSRITVSNALKRLGSEGYVEMRPRRGAIVASLAESDLREIFLIRHALEDIAIVEAASRHDADLVPRLRQVNDAARAAIERNDAEDYRQYEREFHMLLYAASHLRLVSSTLMDLWNRLEPYRNRRHTQFDLEAGSSADRARTIDALARGDGPVAALEMRHHVDRGYDRMLETLRHQAPSIPHRSPGRRGHVDWDAPPGSLLAAYATLTDHRRPQGKLYRQEQLLTLISLANLAGAQSRQQITRWITTLHPAVRQVLGIPADSSPSLATIHRSMGNTDATRVARDWLIAHGYDTGAAEALPDLADRIRTQLTTPAAWERFASLVLHGDVRSSVEASQMVDDLRAGCSD